MPIGNNIELKSRTLQQNHRDIPIKNQKNGELRNLRILGKPIKYCKEGYEREMRGIYKIKSNVPRLRQVTIVTIHNLWQSYEVEAEAYHLM